MCNLKITDYCNKVIIPDISQIFTNCDLPQNKIQAEYHKMSHLRNLTCMKYKYKYQKMKMNGQVLIKMIFVIFSLNNKMKKYIYISRLSIYQAKVYD